MNTKQLKEKRLPSFKTPPVIELVAGVQFERPIGFRTLDLLDIWNGFGGKRKFPQYQEMPPLTPLLPENVHVFNFENIPQLRRIWFEGEDGDALIQIQQDRLIHNWRKISEKNSKQKYPRYNTIIKNFFDYFDAFHEVLRKKNIKEVPPSYLELTYVNKIDCPEEGLTNIGDIFNNAIWRSAEKDFPEPHQFQQEWVYQVPDMPIRISANITTKQSTRDGNFSIQYQLTAKGPFNETLRENMREWYDMAHLWLLHGFVNTTTHKMHKLWGIE